MMGCIGGYDSGAGGMAPAMAEAIATMLEVRAELVARLGEPASPAELDHLVAAVHEETARRLAHERKHGAPALTMAVVPDLPRPAAPAPAPPAEVAPPRPVVLTFERLMKRSAAEVQKDLAEIVKAGRVVHVVTTGDPIAAWALLDAWGLLDLVEHVGMGVAV